MNVRIQILLLIVLSICYGCSTPKFYNEIKSTYESYDTLVSKYGKEAVSESSFDPHKLVMKKLSSYIQNSNHIIYYYSRSTRKWKGKEFSGVVFDVENNKYYYVTNSEKRRPRKIQIDTVYEYPDANYYKFIIDNYRQGKIEYLKKLGEISGHSGIRSWELIYDIDLNSNTVQKHTFEDILFMDGKPMMDVEN